VVWCFCSWQGGGATRACPSTFTHLHAPAPPHPRQAAAFFEPPVLQAFDRLSYTLFKAEVLSAFKKKVQVLADDGFAILVVESCSSATPDTSSSSGSSSSSSSSSSDWHDSDQQHQQQRGAEAGSARAADMSPANRIVGVVEVGVQDERDVLAHLQDPAANLETYAYISSMAVAPHLRRHGVGAALLQTAEAQALAWQQPVLALHVYDSNARAIRLYERHGLLCEARDPAWRSLVGGKVRQLHVKRLRLPC
jgi:ribosomal protein S18 acetylase RimI-like enzyme